jgi:hypothetical protein
LDISARSALCSQTFAGHSTLAVTMDRYGHRKAMDDIAGEVFK